MVCKLAFLLPLDEFRLADRSLGFMDEACIIGILFHLRFIERTKETGMRMHLEEDSLKAGA